LILARYFDLGKHFDLGKQFDPDIIGNDPKCQMDNHPRYDHAFTINKHSSFTIIHDQKIHEFR